MSTYSDKSWNSTDEDINAYRHDDDSHSGRGRQTDDSREGRGSRSSSSSSTRLQSHIPAGRRTSSSGEIDLIPGGVVTTQSVSQVIKPNPSKDPLQFVKISSTDLSKKAVEQIRLAEEVKITKEKIKESDEDWQNNLLSWKSKRRQSRSKLSTDLDEETYSDQGSNRKIKTFSEILAEKKKSGHRIGYNLLPGEDESVDQELEQILSNRNNQTGAQNFEDDNQRRCPDGQETDTQSDVRSDGHQRNSDQRQGNILLQSTQAFDKRDQDHFQDNNQYDRPYGNITQIDIRDDVYDNGISSRYGSETNGANGTQDTNSSSQCNDYRPLPAHNDEYDHRQLDQDGDEEGEENEKDKNKRRQGLNEIQQNVLEYLERQQQHSSNGREYTPPSVPPSEQQQSQQLLADEDDDDLLGHDDSYDYEEWQRQQEQQLISFRQKLSAFENLAKSTGSEGKEVKESPTKPKSSSSTQKNGSRQSSTSRIQISDTTSSPSKNVILTSNNKSQAPPSGSYQISSTTSLLPNKTASLYISQNPSVSASSSAPTGAKIRPPSATSGGSYNTNNSNVADYQRQYPQSGLSSSAQQYSAHPQYNQVTPHDQSYPQPIHQYNAINNQPVYENLVRGSEGRQVSRPIDEAASKLDKLQIGAQDKRHGGVSINKAYPGVNQQISSSNYRQDPAITNPPSVGLNHQQQSKATVNDYYANLPADSRYPQQPPAQFFQAKSSHIPQQVAKSQPKMSTSAQRPMPQYGTEVQRIPHPTVPSSNLGSCPVPQQSGYNRNHWILHEAELRRQMASSQAPSHGQPQSSKIPAGSQVPSTTTHQKPQPLYSNQPYIGNGSGYNNGVTNSVQPLEQQQQKRGVLSVSGRKKCSNCGDELGRGCAAMVIESLHLYYHINCFRCSVCHIQLGNGTCGTDVRVRNQKLHCHNCYSNDEAGLKFSRV